MKKLLLLSAFVAFGMMGAKAQVLTASPNSDVVAVVKDDKPAKDSKKDKHCKKDEKGCGDEKEKGKSCAGEKKACCSKGGHHGEATPVKKEKEETK